MHVCDIINLHLMFSLFYISLAHICILLSTEKRKHKYSFNICSDYVFSEKDLKKKKSCQSDKITLRVYMPFFFVLKQEGSILSSPSLALIAVFLRRPKGEKVIVVEVSFCCCWTKTVAVCCKDAPSNHVRQQVNRLRSALRLHHRSWVLNIL